MPRDKAKSHERLNKAAKEEFLKKGFREASMREIGRLSLMTQAAIYKHYESKEAMFISLLEPLLKELKRLEDNHVAYGYEKIKTGLSKGYMYESNAIEILKELIPSYRDELKLLICCSQGTRYENFLDELVLMEEEGMVIMMNTLESKGAKIKHVSRAELHIILSAYISAMVEPIKHDWPLEEIYHSLDLVKEFFIPGFIKICGFEED